MVHLGDVIFVPEGNSGYLLFTNPGRIPNRGLLLGGSSRNQDDPDTIG